MRRTVAIIAGPVIAALATGAILAVSGAAQTPAAGTIKLVTKSCTHKAIDIPPRSRGRNTAPGAGDGSAGSCQVFDASGARAGAFDAACVFPKDTRRHGAALCQGAYSLAGGDLHRGRRGMAGELRTPKTDLGRARCRATSAWPWKGGLSLSTATTPSRPFEPLCP